MRVLCRGSKVGASNHLERWQLSLASFPRKLSHVLGEGIEMLLLPSLQLRVYGQASRGMRLEIRERGRVPESTAILVSLESLH